MQKLRGLVLILAVLLPGCSSDLGERLRTHFVDNRAQFERLAVMANEDYERNGVKRITDEFTHLNDDWTWPRKNVGLTPQRWNDYRRAFRKLEIPRGIDRLDESGACIRVPIVVGRRGGTEREHGYLWCHSRPERFEQLNAAVFKAEPLDANWYLYEWTIP